MEPYYYNQMSKLQRTAYHGMLTGFQNLSSEFLVPALEGAELSDIFLKLRLDHPEIFWVSGFKMRWYKDSGNIIILPEYLCTVIFINTGFY